MRILYINYVDESKLISGSSVRPARILSAFQQSGHDLLVLKGNQFSPQRKKDVQSIYEIIKKKKPDICYIESPTYPIVHHYDRALISYLHKLGVPTGYFYRDFYLRFPDQFPRRKDFAGRIKDLGLRFLQYLTDKVLYKCDIIYFPSKEATEIFDYKDMRSLPPAGVNRLSQDKLLNHVGIYVGGVIAPYDSLLLLNSFHKLHEEDPSYKLILVCRKEEWEKVHSPYKNEDWIEVHHASGDKLKPLYERASIAFVLPDASFPYNQFAVSVKTFEYISYGLPVVAVNCKALKTLVEKEEIGLAIKPEIDDFVRAVKEILVNQEIYNKWCENVALSLCERNLWSHRVNQIINDLSTIKLNK